MSSCIIRLDNDQGNYNAGEVIQGEVKCSFSSPENIRGIEIVLTGEEHNEWTARERYRDDSVHSRRNRHERRHVHYTGNNTFLKVKNVLRGEGEIGPNVFEFPFSFQLPKNLPENFRGQHGGVFFTVKAKVDRPMRIDYTDKKTINVISPIDLNEIRGQLQLEPSSYSDDKTVGCCCCVSGPITMEVHLEKEAYVPGERAKIKVDISNMSNGRVKGVEVKLITTVESKVTTPGHTSKLDPELLARDRDSRGVGAHSQRTYNFDLEIPQTAAVHNFARCTLFSQSTKLKVTANIGGCHTDMDLESSVTMGHIPVYGQPPSNQEHNKPPSYSSKSPASAGDIGFVVPQDKTPFTPTDGSTYPPPGPSAPPTEDSASAPPKKEATGDDSVTVDVTAPPSYNEAVSTPQKQ